MELTELLHKVRNGDDQALHVLIPLVYKELKALAAGHLRRESRNIPLETTDLVHEAYLKFSFLSLPDFQNRAHFYGIASRLMRQVLVDLARARLAQKRDAGIEIVLTDMPGSAPLQTDAQLLSLHEALQRLEKEHPRKAKLIEMRYFGGMTAEDSADALQMPVHTVRREVRFAQAWLKRVLET